MQGHTACQVFGDALEDAARDKALLYPDTIVVEAGKTGNPNVADNRLP